MKFFGAGILGTALFIESLFAGDIVSRVPSGEPLDPPRFEVAAQSGYLLGVFGNPDSYEIGPEFITGRVRWGVSDSDNWTRGYNNFVSPLWPSRSFVGWKIITSASILAAATISCAPIGALSPTFQAGSASVGSIVTRTCADRRGRILLSTS